MLESDWTLCVVVWEYRVVGGVVLLYTGSFVLKRVEPEEREGKVK